MTKAPIKPPKDGYAFLTDLKNKTQSIATAAGIISGLILTTALMFIFNLKIDLVYRFVVAFFIIFLAISFIASGLAIIAIQPLQKLIFTILFQIKSHPSIKPEMINQPQHVASGFDQLLQFIHQTKQSKQSAKAKSPSLIQAFNKAQIGLVMLDSKLSVVYANELARSLIDQNSRLKFDYDEDESIETWIRQAQTKKVSANKTWHHVASKSNTERRYFDIELSFRKDETVESIITILDRTEFYKPNEEDFEFIAFAAHELRGPITIIKGYLDILETELQPSISSEYRQIFERLTVSANRLSSYINNILNVSRYDHQHLKVDLHETKVRQLIDPVLDDIKLRAKTQNRLLEFDIADNLPSVAADIASIGEVLTNLVDNAVKYSHEGGLVTVKVYQIGDFVNFAVIDRGIGMPSNVVSNLFKKFYRSHRSRETVGGTGIGLYISKAIVDSHGGSITVSSTVDEGSTFTFSLPIFATVAEKLKIADNSNQVLINNQTGGWIRNHGLRKN